MSRMWYPTVQFTCKIWDPKSKEKTWRSLNVTNFTTPPPSSGSKTFDKRSSKADEFSVIHSASSDPAYAESYTVNANLGTDLQISVVVSRPASISGFKFGTGPKGGFSNFGADKEKAEGYVIHRFWPRTHISGLVIHNGKAIDANGTGMFIHAIQGMRPDLIAASWNFADFQSDAHGGTSAIQMEFQTIDAYGLKGSGSGGVKVNIGAVVVGGKLVSVTGETILPKEPANSDPNAAKSRAEHVNPTLDTETGYKQPSTIKYLWEGASVVPEAPGRVKANLSVELGSPQASIGLVEKVDVMAEIPYVIKAFVNYVAGTKPYVYQVRDGFTLLFCWYFWKRRQTSFVGLHSISVQWHNQATLNLTAPAALIDGSGEGEKTVAVAGLLFNEATFIS